MSEIIGHQINYRELLKRHGRISIPMIQRDYAQGRPEEKDLREAFLASLESALKLPVGDPKLPLNLDFVYGSVEGPKANTRFCPLDGQQRLTTLFLLHWFLAWQDGAWDEFGRIFRDSDNLSKFTYKVRESSKEFFNKLVAFEPPARPEDTDSVVSLITDQPWYFRHWRLDPTVQSVLTMLGAIHSRFSKSSGLFARLTDTQLPAITFQLLDLENFGLSDDLYIKMNARGKPLTVFENFKAQYEQVLLSQFAGQSRRVGDRDYSVAKSIALQMDTTWADFFWVHRDQRTNVYDDIVMNLFRVLALVTRDPESKNCLDDLEQLFDSGSQTTYATFKSAGWLDEEFTLTLIALMERWSERGRGKSTFVPLLPNALYFDETNLFTKLSGVSMSLTRTEVTQFAGYALFLRKCSGPVAMDAFQEWMRVVRNLVLNTPMEHTEELRSSARGLRELLPKANEILTHLEQLPEKAPATGIFTSREVYAEKGRVTGFDPPQVKEEQVKAGLIRSHPSWRALIDRAEQHGYFRGQIDFLCEFSGATAQWTKMKGFAWDEPTHLRLQQSFENYLKKAEAMFRASGLVPVGEYRWERALLALGDYLLPMGSSNLSFLVDAATEPLSWKRLLRGGTYPDSPERLKRLFLQQLWDKLIDGPPIAKQLDAIIAGATGLPAWREALVRTPKAIDYCGKRQIKRVSETQIYLLTKTQLSGYHAELFTYCLNEKLCTPAGRLRLKPLDLEFYASKTDTSAPHCLQLRFQYQKSTVYFEVHGAGAPFRVFTPDAPLKNLPDFRRLLTERAGFANSESQPQWLVKPSSFDQIETALADLAKLLATLPAKPSSS